MHEETKEKIKILIEKYEKVRDSGKLKSYTEEETKNVFIKPLFELLGWDFSKKEEVSAEENISGKRVDHGFYINDRIKFYLEAKRLSADLHNEDFANQTIRYSWNKGAVWAVLTDFESIKVFNAQDIKRSLADKLYFEIPYTDYLNRFDQLWLLSKECFENDSLDKDAEAHGKKFQRIPVTSLLYEDLEKCREMLTKELGQMNEKVSPDLLDEGVQKLLDRLIFIRVAEDRGVEDKILIPLVREARFGNGNGKLYESMVKKFREFDSFYNSNLFLPHPFEQWEEYSGVTERVINTLYGKTGYYEYDFKAMPADVLGAVYESYLGHRLAKSKKGLTVAKDAGKRKEHGIYYTPSFIVDYIVKNALGPILDKCNSISDLKKIRVLDPACGSGSFLIKAFNIISEKYKSFGAPNNELMKIQILEENIYGIDLDPQAVEITRLNLLINALDERMKLPFLDNIKNGNSLLMNWKEEFPEVFKDGGFDMIIGNPPYIKEFVNKAAFDDLHNSPYYQGKMDIWTLFGCVAIDLLKEGGILSFIAQNNWVSNAGASIFRNKILKEGELKSFIDFGEYKVFEGAGIQTMIFSFEKGNPSPKYSIDYLRVIDKNIVEDKLIAELYNRKTKIDIKPEELVDKNITFENSKINSILNKIKKRKNFELKEKEVGQGIVCPQEYVIDKHLLLIKNAEIGEGVFILKTDEVKKLNLSKKELEVIKPFYTTEQISRYFINNKNKFWIIYSDRKINKNIDKYPKIKQHLQKYAQIITSDFGPFGLHRARDEKFFKGPSIFSIRKTERPQFSYVDFPCYVSQTYFIISTERANLKFLTGLLNSRLIYFWLKNRGKLQGDLLQIDKEPLLGTPLCIGDKNQQKQIVILVDKMVEFNRELQKTPENSNKWNLIKSEIEKTDKKIDKEVYKLYGLTPEEIKIVESSLKN